MKILQYIDLGIPLKNPCTLVQGYKILTITLDPKGFWNPWLIPNCELWSSNSGDIKVLDSWIGIRQYLTIKQFLWHNTSTMDRPCLYLSNDTKIAQVVHHVDEIALFLTLGNCKITQVYTNYYNRYQVIPTTILRFQSLPTVHCIWFLT